MSPNCLKPGLALVMIISSLAHGDRLLGFCCKTSAMCAVVGTYLKKAEVIQCCYIEGQALQELAN